MNAIALVLLLLLAPQEAGEKPPEAALRIVPEQAIQVGQDLPLPDLQARFFGTVLDAELAALDREQANVSSGGEDRTARITRDRQMMIQFRGATTDVIEPVTISAWHLPPFDRYLYLFAKDRLAAGAYDTSLLEAWEEANTRYLASGDLALRDRAIELRNDCIERLRGCALLRRLIQRLGAGPLRDADRKEYVSLLESRFPELRISTTRMLSAPEGEAAGASPSGAFRLPPPNPDLPRLDGVEHPMGVVRSVVDLMGLAASTRAQNAGMQDH